MSIVTDMRLSTATNYWNLWLSVGQQSHFHYEMPFAIEHKTVQGRSQTLYPVAAQCVDYIHQKLRETQTLCKYMQNKQKYQSQRSVHLLITEIQSSVKSVTSKVQSYLQDINIH
jgi:hypothetical protein